MNVADTTKVQKEDPQAGCTTVKQGKREKDPKIQANYLIT